MIIHIIVYNEVSTCGIELVYYYTMYVLYTFEKVSKTACVVYFKSLLLLCYYFVFLCSLRDQIMILCCLSVITYLKIYGLYLSYVMVTHTKILINSVIDDDYRIPFKPGMANRIRPTYQFMTQY